MGRTTTGFTAAELAAAEWTLQQNESAKQKSRKDRHQLRRDRRHDNSSKNDRGNTLRCEHHSRRHRTRSRSRDRSNSIPRDPRNPLFAAYERLEREKEQRARKFETRKKLRSETESEGSYQRRSRSVEEEEWVHDAFVRRSPSPDRTRTEGRMWDTRRGAWRSKAGGVYLPPEEEEEKQEEFQQPSHYLNPILGETCVRRYFTNVVEKRSPSPIPEERGSPVYE